MRARWRGAAVIAGVVPVFACLVGCGSVAPGRRGMPADEAASWTAGAQDDSLDTIAEEFASYAEGDPAPVEPIADADSTEEQARTVDRAKGRMAMGVPDNWQIDATSIAGTGRRSFFDARVEAGPALLLGFRRDTGAERAFVAVPPGRVRPGVVIGQGTLRMGLGLVLGRRFSIFPGGHSGPNGLRFSPSLSAWFACPGAALDVALGAWRSQLVAGFGAGDALGAHPTTLWAGVSGPVAFARLSLAAGWARPQPWAPAIAARPALVLGHAAGTSAVGRLRIEGAVTAAGDAFAVVDVSGVAGSVTVFHAPRLPSAFQPLEAVDVLPGSIRGVAGETTRRFGRVRFHASTWLGAVRWPEGTREVARLRLALSGRGRRDVDWEVSAGFRRQREERFPSGLLGNEPTVVRVAQSMFRLRLAVGGSSALRHFLRADYFPPLERGDAGGLLLSIRSRATAGRFDLEWSIAAYSIPAGRAAVISRSGAAHVDALAFVRGDGSDVSGRARFHLSRHVLVFAFATAPSSRERRAYVGARIER